MHRSSQNPTPRSTTAHFPRTLPDAAAACCCAYCVALAWNEPSILRAAVLLAAGGLGLAWCLLAQPAPTEDEQ